MRTDFEASYEPPVMRLHIAGELDLSTRKQLGDVLDCADARGCNHVEVDVSEVSFIDAGSLRILHLCQERLRSDGGDLKVVAASPSYHLVCATIGYNTLQPATERLPKPAQHGTRAYLASPGPTSHTAGGQNRYEPPPPRKPRMPG